MYWKKPELNDDNTFQLAPEPVEPSEPTASWWDVQRATVNETMRNYAGFGVSDDLNRDQVYREKNKKIFDATGEELFNPQQSVYGLYYPWMDDDAKARASTDFETYKADGGELTWGGFIRDRWSEQEWRRRADKAIEKHPELRDEILAPANIGEQGMQVGRDASKRAADVWEQSSKGLGAWAGYLAGGFQGQLVDPAFYMAAPLSFGGAGVGAKGLLMGAAKAAGINMATQAVVEPSIADYQTQMGNQYGLPEMAKSVGMAGLFGAGFDLAGRGAFRSVARGMGYEPVVRDGIVVAWRRPKANEAPAPELPDIATDLQERLKAGDESAQTEIMRQLGLDDAIPDAVLQRANEGDIPSIARILEKDAGADPVLRQTLDAAQADELLAVKPRPDMPDIDHADTVIKAVRAVADPEHEPLPVRVYDQPIPEGSYAKLRADVERLRKDLETAGDNRVEIEAKIAGLESQIRMIDTFGRDPVGDALRLRENPQLLTRDFDLEAPKVKQVRALASLSDEAFGLVQEGKASPAVGALVADFVPPELQTRALSDLSTRKPVSAEDGRAMLAELLRSPDYVKPVKAEPGPVPAAAGSPRLLDDPYGADAKLQVQALEQKFREELKAIGKDVPQAIDAIATPEGRVATISRAQQVEQALADMLPMAPERTRLRIFEAVDELPPTLAAQVRAGNAIKFQRALDRYLSAATEPERLAAGRVMQQAKRLQGIEGIADGDTIWIAAAAMNPRATFAHEVVHALRRSGVVAPEEVRLMAAAARESGVFSENAESLYRNAYGNEFPTREALDDVIDEEAAAHYIEAVVKGTLPADAPPHITERGIVERIRELLNRIREVLTGQGFRQKASDTKVDPARDVVDAILSGEVARREVKAEWMRNNPQAVTALKHGAAMAREALETFKKQNDYTAVSVQRDGALFAFAGENARTANKIALAMAKNYDKAGLDRDSIWQRTGWFKGVDGKWRFETDDSLASLGDLRRGNLVDVLDNPDLMRAYPDMQGIAADFRRLLDMPDGAKGSYSDNVVEKINVQAPDFDEMLSVGLHEMQHAVQTREGFAFGGNAEQFLPEQVRAERDFLISVADKVPAGTWELMGAQPQFMSDNQVRTLLYAKLAGEVEARTVQKRANMTAAERAARPPWMDYDIPERAQIIEFYEPKKAQAEFKTDAKAWEAAGGVELPGGVKVKGVPLWKFADSNEGRWAYHGTPWRFDRFSLSAIGTGEGAQVYGYGLYFAGNRKVAEWYKEVLTKRHAGSVPLTGVEKVVALDGRRLRTTDFKTPYMRHSASLSDLSNAGSVQAWRKQMQKAYQQLRRIDPVTAREMQEGINEVADLDYDDRLSWRDPQKGEALLVGGKPLPREDSVFADEIMTTFSANQNADAFVTTAAKWGAIASYFDYKAKDLRDTYTLRVGTPLQRIMRGKVFRETFLKSDHQYLLDEAKQFDGYAARAREHAKNNTHVDLPDKPEGALYEVYLKVDDEDLLDWDAPLSQQPPHAQPVIDRLIAGAQGNQFDIGIDAVAAWKKDEHTLGQLMQGFRGGGRDPESMFKAAGIRGLKYLDGSSRSRGSGSHNYVIFDEDAIEILAVNDQPVKPVKERALFSMTDEPFDQPFMAKKAHGSGIYVSARGPGYGYTESGEAMLVKTDPARVMLWDRPRQPDEVRRALDAVANEQGLNFGAFPRGEKVYKALAKKLGSDEAATVALREAGLHGHALDADGYQNTVVYDPDLVQPDPRAGMVSRETMAVQQAAKIMQQARDALGRAVPLIEEDAVPADRITLPIDPAMSPADKLSAIRQLTAENKPMLDQQLAAMDAKLGTSSNANIKEEARILEKASRPSILAKKPWHGVEHIRDTLRFQTKIKTFDQIEKAAAEMLGNGYRIVKVDTEKMLEPKEWGWRFAGFDLRAPNGQLVEWYIIFDQMYEAKKTKGGHKLFEDWRNLSAKKIQARQVEYYADLYASQKLYREAFEDGLRASGFTGLDDAADSIRSLSASLPEIAAKFSARSSGMMTPAGAQELEGLARNIAEPLASTTSARPDSLSSRTSDSDIGASPSNQNVGAKSPASKGSGQDASTQGLYGGIDIERDSSGQIAAVIRNGLRMLVQRDEAGNISGLSADQPKTKTGKAGTDEGSPPPALFSMTNEDGRMKRGAERRAKGLKLDLDQIEADLAAAAIDQREAIQRKRATFLNAQAEETGLDDIVGYRSPRGQEDVAIAFLRMHESLGVHGAPFMDLRTQRDLIAKEAIGMMDEVMWQLRKGAFTGDVRRVANKAVRTRMENMIREAAGEATKDPVAKRMAEAWLKAAEYLRQRFNAAGGDIGKLEGWFAPQYHDAERLLRAGRQAWTDHMMQDGVLDRDRMRNFDGSRMSDGELRNLLRDVWETITTDGANKREPGDGFGKGALYKRHAEHRVLHFKNADAFLAYAKEFGGSDPYAMMVGHISMMARDIAAMERFGANPEMVRERLKGQIKIDAKTSKSARSVYDDLSDLVSDLKQQMRTVEKPADRAMKKISDLHTRLDEIRGKPRYNQEREKLQRDLLQANRDLADALQPAAVDPQSMALMQRILAVTDEMEEIVRTQSVLSRNPEERATRILGRADEMWRLYMGHTNVPMDGRIAGGLSGLRNWVSSSMLVFAPMSAVTDQATGLAARAFVGMPVTKQLGSFLKAFTPEDRKFALRAGIGLDQAMNAFAVSQRFFGYVSTAHVTGYIADRTHALSLLAPMTQAAKVGFASDFMAWMADLAKTKTWSSLEPWTRQMMDRHGFTEQDFAGLKAAVPESHRGVAMMTRNAIERAAGPETAERFMRMLLREQGMAVLEPTLQGRTAFISETKPGTVIGEMARSAAMLKSFPTSYMMLIMGRFYNQALAGRAFSGNTVAAGAAILVVGTLLGALAMQLKSLGKGQDPQPMDNTDFWMKAFFQSGGLGIYGDFINNAINRQGGSLAQTLAGPMAGEGQLLLNLTLGNLAQYAQDEPTNFGREMVSYVRQRTPGAFVPWYIRTAYERMVLDELQKMVDPEAHSAFRRKIRNQKKLGGNEFYWRPGVFGPDRGPDLGAAFGAQ